MIKMHVANHWYASSVQLGYGTSMIKMNLAKCREQLFLASLYEMKKFGLAFLLSHPLW